MYSNKTWQIRCVLIERKGDECQGELIHYVYKPKVDGKSINVGDTNREILARMHYGKERGKRPVIFGSSEQVKS